MNHESRKRRLWMQRKQVNRVKPFPKKVISIFSPHRFTDVRWVVCARRDFSHNDYRGNGNGRGVSTCRPSSTPVAHWPRVDGSLAASDHRLPAIHAPPRAPPQARVPASRQPYWHRDRRSRDRPRASRWWPAGMATERGAQEVLCSRHRTRPAVSGVAEKVTIKHNWDALLLLITFLLLLLFVYQ